MKSMKLTTSKRRRESGYDFFETILDGIWMAKNNQRYMLVKENKGVYRAFNSEGVLYLMPFHEMGQWVSRATAYRQLKKIASS
jgi:hypothetical protein